jgi:hypothetical protein
MKTHKSNRILYWVFTVLVLLPTGGSAFPELFAHGPKATVQSYLLLGYPLYLMKILGFAKILGGVAILTDRSRRITDWAYAGFGILFLGATASHLFAGDLARAPIPLVFFFILVGSYSFWTRSKTLSFEQSEQQ